MARQCNVEVKDRREAVLSLLRREEPAAAIARRVGVSEQTLYRWRDEFLAGGEAALGQRSGQEATTRAIGGSPSWKKQIETPRPGDRRVHDRQPDSKKTFGRRPAERRESRR